MTVAKFCLIAHTACPISRNDTFMGPIMLGDWLTLLGIKHHQGIVLLRSLGCRKAQENGEFCAGCHPHDGWGSPRVIPVKLGRAFGKAIEGLLMIRRPRCADGKVRCEWPKEFNQKARLPLAGMVGFLLDAIEMSVKQAAARHGFNRGKASQLFATFCAQFWLDYIPQVPKGRHYIGLDVGHLQGQNFLLVAVVTPKGEKGSHLITILFYTTEEDRVVARDVLRGLPGAERILAVVCDLSDELSSLIAEVWPWAMIVGDLRHVLGEVLRPLARARNLQQQPRRMTARTPVGQRREGAKTLLEKTRVPS